MDIKPIKNEENYNDALRRVEELWGAALGSKEGDELEVLTNLIETYERQHYPIERPVRSLRWSFGWSRVEKVYRSLIGVTGSGRAFTK